VGFLFKKTAVRRQIRKENMKERTQINTRFAPEARFEVKPAVAPFRVTEETELERLKNRLLLNELRTKQDPEFNAILRRAANEAAAVAWTTRFPLLVFPALFEEKAKVVDRQVQKQRQIRLRTQNMFAVAA
jgi:hypothetical protein